MSLYVANLLKMKCDIFMLKYFILSGFNVQRKLQESHIMVYSWTVWKHCPVYLSNTTFQQLQLWSLADGIKYKKGDRVFQKHGLKKKAMFGMGCYHIIYTVNCLLLVLFLAACFNFSFSLVFVWNYSFISFSHVHTLFSLVKFQST